METLATTQPSDNAELFVKGLKLMVETCLPGDDLDLQNPYPNSLGIASNLNLSSSMSSLSVSSMHSPTDKDPADGYSLSGSSSLNNGSRMRHMSANNVSNKVTRSGSLKRTDSGKRRPPFQQEVTIE